METLKKSLEIVANVAVVLVAVLLAYFFLNRYFNPPRIQATYDSQIRPGTRLQVKEIDFSKGQRNLILVLSTDCHFCSDSMQFYRKLTELNSSNRKLRMIASFPQDLEISAKYLKERDVEFDEIIKADATAFVARGTPTLILTDGEGVVLDSWYGRLKPEKETEMVEKAFTDVKWVVN